MSPDKSEKLFSSLKAVELIKRLAEANVDQIDSASTDDTIKVYQLLRVVPYEGLEEMWKQFAGNEEHRWSRCTSFLWFISIN